MFRILMLSYLVYRSNDEVGKNIQTTMRNICEMLPEFMETWV